MTIPVDWTVAGPATIVLAGALVALLVDAFYSRRTWLGSGLPSTVAVVIATLELFRADGPQYTVALSLVVLLGTLFVVVASNIMNFENAMPPGEYHFLLLSAAAGALLMVGARDLVTLVVALELLSLPTIALVGLRQGDQRAVRSAWTFFLASVVSTAITLMGVSLLYGIAGSLDYDGIRDALVSPDVPGSVVAVAVVPCRSTCGSPTRTAGPRSWWPASCPRCRRPPRWGRCWCSWQSPCRPRTTRGSRSSRSSRR
jgi:NADH-quinone oxidoreductase subunit N